MHSRNQLYLVLVVVLTALSAFGFYKSKFSYGLDIQGGVRLTYLMDMTTLSKANQGRAASMQSDLTKILENRVNGSLGVGEATVQPKGDDQLVIELPGYTDIERAKQILSSTAKIQVYHAKNVTTPVRQLRYAEAGRSSEGGRPEVDFYRTVDPSKTIKPGDDEYKKMIEGWDLILEGEDVTGAQPLIEGNKTKPEFFFGGQGARNLETWSRKYAGQQENIAFVLDGVVLNIAPLEKNAILSTTAFINGDFDPKYVTQLCDLIKSGSLPVELKELASEQVDPTIGKGALHQMVTASGISMGLIALFLIVYYGFPGVVATIALGLYTLFTLTVLRLANATFSLAAIAAFVLSVAMAVDANILVFERVKEEMRNGKKLLSAIDLGFKRALTAIIDSNICTILTSVVLWVLGQGTVKGFATTLILGVVISFFTAITVTRSLLLGCISMNWFNDPKYFALGRNWFGEALEQGAHSKTLNIIPRMKLYFGISAVLIIPGLICFAMGGLKPNVEFQGGYEAQFVGTGSENINQIRDGLEKAGFKGGNVKSATVSGKKVVYITLPPSNALPVGDPDAKNKIAKAAGLNVEGSSLAMVGPTIQKESIQSAVLGVLISSALIVVYLGLRFGFALGGMKNGLKFGGSAVIALFHDVLFVVGNAAVCGMLFGWEVSSLFVTAMLTVIGFSVHDTIIIFDRIRENLVKPIAGETFQHIVDKSITQSIARSLNTSMTAIATLVILTAVGTPTPELKFMCVTMLMGIITGTYSSIANASPILFIWDKLVIKRRGEEHGLLGEATREAKQRAAMAVSYATAGASNGATEAAKAEAKSGYGQVRRRRSVVDQASQEIDE
ncbi:MAG: protein translocase subunit SecD [Fimbriimonadaceae bacterium]|nr:protein translocase subunit SecD [Fimbriimonadaceae bacterium]